MGAIKEHYHEEIIEAMKDAEHGTYPAELEDQDEDKMHKELKKNKRW